MVHVDKETATDQGKRSYDLERCMTSCKEKF